METDSTDVYHFLKLHLKTHFKILKIKTTFHAYMILHPYVGVMKMKLGIIIKVHSHSIFFKSMIKHTLYIFISRGEGYVYQSHFFHMYRHLYVPKLRRERAILGLFFI